MSQTNPQTIEIVVTQLRDGFKHGTTRSLEFRQQQLAGMERFLNECQQDICQALQQDLGKPYLEAFTTEIAFILAELRLVHKKLAQWMKPERRSTSLWAQPGKSYIYSEPYGVVLIISPWNFPFQLSLAPLIGAIAAGNCTVLKPSEMAPATSRLLASKLPQYINSTCLQVVEGDAETASSLLAQKFDYIFYTGNGTVGRIVMQAAAKNLTPVTLELGGKSPCIVDENVDMDVVARRILFGKFYNAGQVCVAPDYVLVHHAVEEDLLSAMQKVLKEFYGDNPQNSSDFARIINDRHFQRIMKLIPGSGEVFSGGNVDEASRYIAPTILRKIPIDAPIMQEEIFGPILPVLVVKNIEEAINFINARSKPLALYIFSNNSAHQEAILAQTSSGSVAINYTNMQFMLSSMPTGGVGESGMGAYHGKASFDTFSHRKYVLKKSLKIDFSFVYPPYTADKIKGIRAAFLNKFW